MTNDMLESILKATAFIRTSGSPEELQCANYLMSRMKDLGLEPRLEPFPVPMAEIQEARLLCDGVEIPCTGYKLAGNADLEAPVCYLTNDDPVSLAACKGKIVLSDKLMGYWHYQDMQKAGALGFITYNGNVLFPDTDLEPRELRPEVSEGHPLPGVHVHARTAVELVAKNIQTARIVLKQREFDGFSHNILVDLPGESDDLIVFSAHYDSTPLSVGTWDNMTGSVAILALAEHFLQAPHRASLRFLWCGSEERGLLGSKAYVKAHTDELRRHVLNINLDMVGSIMGPRTACCTSEDKLVHYLEYLAAETGMAIRATQGVYPSDSTPFADGGIPAISFARDAPANTATIHNRYDTFDLLSMDRMQEDIAYIQIFADRMANARVCPVSRDIPDNMKKKLDEYMHRVRPEH